MEMLRGTSPSVHIFLPPDVPISLDLDLREGGARVELGEMWLTEADIDFNRCGFQLEVSEPLRAPMDLLSSSRGASARARQSCSACYTATPTSR